MEHTKAYQEFKKNSNTKFVRYSEGAEMYHMGVSKFMQRAKDAKAIYKLGQLVLVNLIIFDAVSYTHLAEFLGFSQNTDFTESDLEKSILSNLQKFLMELGKGYAFVARQQHIHTEKQDYYIDLVFYLSLIHILKMPWRNIISQIR